MTRLTNESKALLLVSMLLTAGMVTVGTFINVFLLRATDGNVSLIIIQNIIVFITLWLAFVAGSKVIAKISITTLQRFGLLSIAIYFMVILLLQDHLGTFLVPLAIFHGFGSGLYWFATNLLIAKVIKETEQGRYFGYQQTAGSVLGVVTPAVSGFVITRFTDLTGYYILFGISLIFFALAVFMTKKIPDFTLNTKIHIYEVLKLKGNRYWDAGKNFRFVIAVKEAIHGQIFMLFAFVIFQNEGVIGNIVSATALITVFSSLWFARVCTRENQQSFYLKTASIMMIMYFLLALFPYVPVLIAVWIVFGIIQSWAATILPSVIFQLAGRAKGGFEQNDYLVALEFPTTMGRIIGLSASLLLIHFINSDVNVYRLLFVIIAIGWILEYIIIEKQVKWFRDELPMKVED